MTSQAIELNDVHFAWPRGAPVLAIPRFAVARGESVFLKGASGSGKSTLLGLIGGVLQQARGSILVLGTSMRDLRGSRKDAFRAAHVGYIFQMFNLLARPLTEMSIGQQQRVAAARALLGRPDLVIADEPTSALDADTRQGFLDMLRRECAGAGSTLLFVSHDTTLARSFDRTVSMSEINHAESHHPWP
jgi:putative ABC transport system ATP-binding protein